MPALVPLRSRHSCTWSIVKTSGTQFQNYLVVKESVSLLSLLAFREKKPKTERGSSLLQRQQGEEAVQGPERGHPKPQMDSSSLYTPCVKASSTTENQNQSQALWQPSRRLLSQWHLARPSAPNSLWSAPFWLFIKSIFFPFCIHSIGQLQIPFFYLI